MATIEKYYTLTEITEITGIPKPTLRDHLKKATLRARLIAGKWRVSESDLKAFIEAAPTNYESREA